MVYCTANAKALESVLNLLCVSGGGRSGDREVGILGEGGGGGGGGGTFQI